MTADSRSRALAATSPDVLPDSRLKDTKARIFIANVPWVPIFCANCGRSGGHVPEENMDFAFYLCNPCAETYGKIAGMMLVPDEVFFEKVKQAQLEKYGRSLTQEETVEKLKDENSIESKLARERKARRNPEPVPAPSRKPLAQLPVAKGSPGTRACLVCGVFYPTLSYEVVPGRPRSKICSKCLDEGTSRVFSRECVECGVQFESASSRASVCEACKPARDARLAVVRQRRHRSRRRTDDE